MAAIRLGEVRGWLFDEALPLWSSAGLDILQGGSVESLRADGRDSTSPFKRTRVQARQVYAFSHARLMGWDGPGAQGADHCWRFLHEHARRGDGGWVRSLRPDGGVVDATMDAYDMAFVLYALAWRARLGDPDAAVEAHATLDALDAVLATGMGWKAAEDNDACLQNPHMHLLEAFLELAAVTGHDRFFQAASGVVRLFLDRILDPALGAFGEAFGPGWAPSPVQARKIEPGHQYEWVWLLCRASEVLGQNHFEAAEVLYRFAEERGRDPRTGLVCDTLTGPSLTPSSTHRIWPQTEALKAQIAMFEHRGLDTRTRMAAIVQALLDDFLAGPPRGGWRDRLGEDQRPISGDMPASTLYHLVLAFSELIRAAPRLASAPI